MPNHLDALIAFSNTGWFCMLRLHILYSRPTNIFYTALKKNYLFYSFVTHRTMAWIDNFGFLKLIEGVLSRLRVVRETRTMAWNRKSKEPFVQKRFIQNMEKRGFIRK